MKYSGGFEPGAGEGEAAGADRHGAGEAARGPGHGARGVPRPAARLQAAAGLSQQQDRTVNEIL